MSERENDAGVGRSPPKRSLLLPIAFFVAGAILIALGVPGLIVAAQGELFALRALPPFVVGLILVGIGIGVWRSGRAR